MDLTLVLAGVIVFGVGAYVILDGFDLGVGILFPLMPHEDARDTAIACIAPIWDGNETWLSSAVPCCSQRSRSRTRLHFPRSTCRSWRCYSR